MADIKNLREQLQGLPRGISWFVNNMEKLIDDLESLLGSPFPTAPPVVYPPGPITPEESLTDITPIPAPSTELPVPPLSPTSSLCRPAAGAGPLVPCPPNRSTQTTTTTGLDILTTQVAFASANRTGIPYGTRTAPWINAAPCTTYQFGNGSAVTLTVQYATPASSFTTQSYMSYSPSPTPSAYTFDPDAPDNVAVYYGQSPDTQEGGLLALCQDSNVDITILAFVYDFFGPNNYPSIDFGPSCSAPNAAQAQEAPGLANCSTLATEIAACQQLGKKVLVSLGGYIANSSFVSDYQAQEFAATLWNLFGAGKGDNPDLRPFGPDVIVDGFDIDNENHDTGYYQTFALALRGFFDQDPSKTYYLSAAPQCPMPDESIPMEAMAVADFVWVQFYNNPQCNLDSDGFQSSFATWSANLSTIRTASGRPRLYIGAGAFAGAGTGYVVPSGLSSAVSLARERYVNNLGGIMLWDGSEAMANFDQYGTNYLEYAKSSLQT